MIKISLIMIVIGLLSLQACGSARTSNASMCSSTQSLIKTSSISKPNIVDGSSGLLLTKHIDHSSENLLEAMSTNEVLRQCNSFLELHQENPPKVRIWTASHCVKPLLLKSMTLAIRDQISSSGLYHMWELEHKVIQDGIKMRRVYDSVSSRDQAQDRRLLFKAFDRRNMSIEGTTAVLNPSVSCENLRWSQDADSRHSLCFSIFDLIYFDVDLPEPESSKSKALVASLLVSKKTATTEVQIEQKRDLFLRRMKTTSQAGWIVHESERLQNEMGSLEFFQNSGHASSNVELNREVFSLPHPEESSFMPNESLEEQDAVPPALNQMNEIKSLGNYISSSGTINDVVVGCYRQLKKYNIFTGAVEVIPELEKRPHKFCPGGENAQNDHFWIRNKPWSWMMADLTLGAAQQYSKQIYDLASETLLPAERNARFEIVSSFGVREDLGFTNVLTDLTTPLLRHLRISVSLVTDAIVGFDDFDDTGAFLFSLPIAQAQARFVKGDSGSIVLLDGVPVATLYSVDGEETSGGSSILSLPEFTEVDEDGASDRTDPGTRSVSRGRVGRPTSSGPSGAAPTSTTVSCK